MPISIRAIFVLVLLVAPAACSSSLGAGSTPAAAAPAYLTPDSGGYMVFERLAIRPDAGAPVLLMNFVSNGVAQRGVPCISCVKGAPTKDTIGLTGPSSYIPNGAEWQYSLSFTNLSYKGSCTLAWTITAGKKTLDSFSAKLTLPGPGSVLYGLNRSRPSYHGSATLTGRATCGTSKPSLSAPLYFQ